MLSAWHNNIRKFFLNQNWQSKRHPALHCSLLICVITSVSSVLKVHILLILVILHPHKIHDLHLCCKYPVYIQ